MSTRVPRLNALLAGALLLFMNAGGMLGHVPCPQHDGEAGHVHGGTGAPGNRGTEASGHRGHAMASEAAPAPKSDHQGPHGPCTCLDHCSACQTLGVPAVAAALPETLFTHSSRAAVPASDRHVPARVPHQLPFANAPPVVA